MGKKFKEDSVELQNKRIDLKSKLNRVDIQFLRAIAVLAVIAYHFKVQGFAGGFVGVDIFFVISGYLIFQQIYNQHIQNKFSLFRFFEARIRRIFPALVVVCFATAVWGWYFVLPRDYVALSRAILRSVCFISNISSKGEMDYFAQAADTKLLLHTWSLSVEAQFYIWLPLLILVLARAGKTHFILPLILTALASLFFTLYLSYVDSNSGFYSVFARSWEFVFGALIAMVNIRIYKNIKAILVICSLGLVASISQIDSELIWPSAWTLMPVGFAGIFIYFAESEQKNPILANVVFQRIGDMSYSLYLWHWPVWVCAKQLFNNSITGLGKIALLFVVYGLAYLSWRWVERPFRNRQIVTTKQLMMSALVALLFVISFLAYVLIHKGAPERFPDYVGRASIQGHMGYTLGKCQRSSSNEKDYSEEFCVFGASNKINDATLMIWGDSHASQYLSPLVNASTSLKMTGLVATMSGCRSFMETDDVQYSDYPHCKEFNREVFTYLGRHKNIHTVILGRIWFNSTETIDRTVLLVRELIKQGHQVILITPLPVPGMHVENEWAMRQIRAGHEINEIRIDASPEVKQSAVLVELSKQLKPELVSGKLYLIDPTQQLCDAKSCYAVRDGVANFRDISHLSELAARQMEPSFQKALIWSMQAN